MAVRSDDVKELRLALVCYGGVSLAIYMHGITKEIFKLVRASRALDADLATPTIAGAAPTQPAPDWDSEYVYYDALQKLAAHRQLSVTVDIIGGTSAGGINGVCLARGLALSRSLDGFRDLWIDDGSIVNLLERDQHDLREMLIRGPLKMLKHRFGKRMHTEGLTGAPLNGDKMSRMLCKAFDDMALLAAPSPATLLPDGGGIELLVTTTDLDGYDVLVDTGAGGVSNSDKSYRQVLRFTVPNGPVEDFEGDGPVAALTFAARATSSFPGAFPPVSVGTFQRALSGEFRELHYDVRDITRHFVYDPEFGAKPDVAWYVDGGVLDNAPFDHVVDAIATKRAELETVRHLIYVQPDPGHGPVASERVPEEPTWFKTVRGSLSTIPKHKSTIDALESLREMNERIAEVGRIADTQSEEVMAALPETSNFGMRYDESVSVANEVRAAAMTAAGQTYGTYCRLRAVSAAESFADGLSAKLGYAPDSNEATLVTEVLTIWVETTTAWSRPSPEALETELAQADVDFRTRRARFVAQGVNELLHAPGAPGAWSPPRGDLVAMKAASWDLVKRVGRVGATALSAVKNDAAAILGPTILVGETVASDPKAFAADHATELGTLFASYKTALAPLTGSSEALWEILTSRSSAWGDAGKSARESLLSRYLAFPIWDVLIFPVIALSGLPQLTQINVTRFSPVDATALAPVDRHDRAEREDHKLKGRVLHHFGGFFDKGWRENDYLWGRLDAAELILKLLSQEGEVELPDSLRDQGFRTILESERPGLTKIRDVIDDLLDSLPGATGA